MTAPFITIAEAVQLTGKSRRTIQRLVESLLNKQPDQVMKEKTKRGYIWRLSEQSVQKAYGVAGAPAGTTSPVNQQPVPAPTALPFQFEKYMDLATQGYTGMMTLHEEVKQGYEERLKEKDERIAGLTQDLEQARKGLWVRIFGS